MERVPMTPQGVEKLRKEIDQIKSVERPKVVREIEVARAHGDLSENAEYHAAKERLGHLQGRMNELEGRLSKVEIIDPKTLKGSPRVMFGAHVTVLDVAEEREMTYQIVGEYEANALEGKISVGAPVARALIGKEAGSLVQVRTPKGPKEFELLRVEYRS